MNEAGLWVVHPRRFKGALRDSIISMISDYFKEFVSKRKKNMCSLEKLAHQAVGEKLRTFIIRTSGTQRKDLALSTEMGFPGGSGIKNLPVNAEDARDARSIPGSGRSPGERNGSPLQYSCLGNPMDCGAWWATKRHDLVTKPQLKWSRMVWEEVGCSC